MLYAYVDIYLKEEVAAEQLVRNLGPFRRFLHTAAQSHGHLINFSKIERDAALGATQAQKHFEILEDTLIGRFLPPYSQSVRKRQAQQSKFYFFDPGVVRALKFQAEKELTPQTFEYGLLFEGFLINEFFRLNDAYSKHWQFSYLRSGGDVEIDLIIERPDQPKVLIEIKSSKEVRDYDFKNLLHYKKDFKGAELLLLYNGQTSFVKDEIRCMNWLEGLQYLFQARH